MSRQGVLPYLLAAMCCTASASAQEIAWHAGVGVTGELDTRGGATVPGQFQLDGHSATLLLGAELGKGFGVEASWVDVGTGLWSIGATHVWRPSSFEPHIKVGWFSHDGEETGLPSWNSRDKGMMAEFGLRWKPAHTLAMRLSYGWYAFDAGGDGSAQLASEWHF